VSNWIGSHKVAKMPSILQNFGIMELKIMQNEKGKAY
jgi:hypothetical protein